MNRTVTFALFLVAAAGAAAAGLSASFSPEPPRDHPALAPVRAAPDASPTRKWQRPNVATSGCSLPTAPGDAHLIAYGTYEGDAIASAVIGGPDQETHLIDVTIERGSQPLYLLLTSYDGMVWRIGGATHRVRHVVVSAYAAWQPGQPGRSDQVQSGSPEDGEWTQAAAPVSASGVIGIPRHKVTIASRDCPRFFHEQSAAEAALAPALSSIGRNPDAVFTSYSASRIDLPSGRIGSAKRGSAPLPAGFDLRMWNEASRFWPGGLVRIAPEEVVAAAPVATYQVLPSQMGLAQLIGAGAIQPLGDDRFRVVRPIPHLPPGMAGAHSATLVLAGGVPRPPGDPGHSCIVEERNFYLGSDRRC